MRAGSAVVAVVLLAFLSACGGGSSASDRVAACQQRYRAGLTDTAAARRAVSALCTQAEQAGLLDDHGGTTADQLRTLLKTHPDALSPLCQLSLQASLGADTPRPRATCRRAGCTPSPRRPARTSAPS